MYQGISYDVYATYIYGFSEFSKKNQNFLDYDTLKKSLVSIPA